MLKLLLMPLAKIPLAIASPSSDLHKMPENKLMH